MCRHGLWIQRRDSLTFNSFNNLHCVVIFVSFLATFWGSATMSWAAPVNFCLQLHHSTAQRHRFRHFIRLTCTSGNSGFQHVPAHSEGKTMLMLRSCHVGRSEIPWESRSWDFVLLYFELVKWEHPWGFKETELHFEEHLNKRLIAVFSLLMTLKKGNHTENN